MTQNDAQRLEALINREWISTNRVGSYASSSAAGCHTRKYHGWLVSQQQVLVSKCEETVVVGKEEQSLGCNKYPGGHFHPRGDLLLSPDVATLAPTDSTTTWTIGKSTITRTIEMVPGEETTLVHYTLSGPVKSALMKIQPLLAYRSVHALTRENMGLRVRTFPIDDGFKIDPYPGMPCLFCSTDPAGSFFPGPFWVKNVEYPIEQTRGFEYQEDLFCPGVFELKLTAGHALTLRLSTESPAPAKPGNTKGQQASAAKSEQPVDAAATMLVAPIEERPDIAFGYHWGTPSGRVALASIPGLLLCTGKTKEAVEVLRGYSASQRDGLIAERRAMRGATANWNSGDTSFWFVWAVQEYGRRTGDQQTVRDLFFDPIRAIIDTFIDGRVPFVWLQSNGLLGVGGEGGGFTWMNALVDGQPVTPRRGLAVEVNALWYNALSYYLQLCREFEFPLDDRVVKAYQGFRDSFTAVFKLEPQGWLADSIHEGRIDGGLRPNQILAVSLPFSPLSTTDMTAIVTAVSNELVTPFGLRTLSPADSRYHGRISAWWKERDGNIHQGPVWTWYLGHYVDAVLRTAKDRAEAVKVLKKQFSHLLSAPLPFGECWQGDAPHEPLGLAFSSWATAELIRAKDVLAKAKGLR